MYPYLSNELGIWIMDDLNNGHKKSPIQMFTLVRCSLFRSPLYCKHLKVGNIWKIDFNLPAIQMPDNCPLFKWHLNSQQNCLIFRCPITSVIYLCSVQFCPLPNSENHLNNGPFNDWTKSQTSLLLFRSLLYMDCVPFCFLTFKNQTFSRFWIPIENTLLYSRQLK